MYKSCSDLAIVNKSVPLFILLKTLCSWFLQLLIMDVILYSFWELCVDSTSTLAELSSAWPWCLQMYSIRLYRSTQYCISEICAYYLYICACDTTVFVLLLQNNLAFCTLFTSLNLVVRIGRINAKLTQYCILI